DCAAAAALVFDQNGLRQLLVETIDENAGVEIDATARRNTDDEFDRAVQPGALGLSRRRGERNQRRNGEPAQHGFLPIVVVAPTRPERPAARNRLSVRGSV